MDVKLIAFSPKGRRKEFSLRDDVTILGRQEGCHLHIPLNEISRQHCQFLLTGDTVSIKDLGSANGTFVNGQKVTQQDLEPGDVVWLASALSFMVQIDGQPEHIDEQKLRTPTAAEPTGQKPTPASAPPAGPLAGTTTSATDESEADLILSESFFLENDEDDEDDEDDDDKET